MGFRVYGHESIRALYIKEGEIVCVRERERGRESRENGEGMLDFYRKIWLRSMFACLLFICLLLTDIPRYNRRMALQFSRRLNDVIIRIPPGCWRLNIKELKFGVARTAR